MLMSYIKRKTRCDSTHEKIGKHCTGRNNDNCFQPSLFKKKIMKILMFFPGQIDHLPPLMTAAICMADLGATVRVVASGLAKETEDYLSQHRVELSIESSSRPINLLERIFLRIRVGIRLIREKLIFLPDCIWYHGPFAMEYALIPGINKKCLIVAHAHELCDTEKFLGFISRIVPRFSDIVIVPEINRLWILKISSKSKGKFFCVPNRPLNILSDSKSRVLTKSIFLEKGGCEDCTKFIIYQGAFMKDRCLYELISGFKEIPYKDVGLILMGGDTSSSIFKELQELAKSDQRIVFLPRIAPPNHLEVTKGCIGGVLLYKPDKLNNIYCAPNKIFEYASLGLGMVLPNYPGLESLSKEFGFGHFCDPLRSDSIKNAIMKLLEKNAYEYQDATNKFLNSVPQLTDVYSEIYRYLIEKKK